MSIVSVLPYWLVDEYRNPGIDTDAGYIALDQYLCGNPYNGGNDNCADLIQSLRVKKDKGTGPKLQDMFSDSRLDILLKGQGRPEDFATIWNFMFRNKDHLKKIDVKVRSRRPKSGSLGAVEKSGNIYDLYFKGKSDAEAIKQMIKDRFFGIDCIGFVANFMIYAGLWDKYKGANPNKWDNWHFTKEVKKARDIEPLNILLWSGHIAIVDWVWEHIDDKTVKVDICQSSSGEVTGPQCNERVLIQEMSSNVKIYNKKDDPDEDEPQEYRKTFKILHAGSPRMPVDGHVYIMKRKNLELHV